MTANDTLHSEVEYIRTLAEAGKRTPLLSGAHLAAIGTLAAAAFTGHWAVLSGQLESHGVQPGHIWFVWIGFGAAMGLAMVLLEMRLRGRPGYRATNNQAEGFVWSTTGFALSGIAIGAIGHMIYTGDYTAPNMIPPAAFSLYGLGLMGSAFFSDEKYLRAFGVLSIFFSIVIGVFADASWMYLAAASGVLCVLTAPGVILMLREPRAVV